MGGRSRADSAAGENNSRRGRKEGRGGGCPSSWPSFGRGARSPPTLHYHEAPRPKGGQEEGTSSTPARPEGSPEAPTTCQRSRCLQLGEGTLLHLPEGVHVEGQPQLRAVRVGE